MGLVITYTQDNGVAAIIAPAPGVPIDRAMQDVPEGKTGTIVNGDSLPMFNDFRDAWVEQTPGIIIEEVVRCKEIVRRQNERSLNARLLGNNSNAQDLPQGGGPPADKPGRRPDQQVKNQHSGWNNDTEDATTVEELRVIMGEIPT